jgi:choline dehydrogenase-like flavoprotein
MYFFNISVLTQAMVGKVLLSNDTTPHATGVEFRNQNGTTYTTSANREVLLTAGSIMTPIILQHSGIGPASVLEAAGVKQILDLPVGQNLIDQTTYTTNWATKTKGGLGLPIMFPRFEDLVTGDDAKNLRGMLENNIDVYVEDAVKSGAASNATAAGLKKVLEIQRDWILSKNSSVSESFDYTYDNVIGYDSWFLLPFGRGSISISNSDPYGTNYTIDPRYFANEFDTLASAATARFTRSYSESAPLSEHMANETTPGDSVQASASLEDWATWIKTTYRPNWHPIGTASMMSKDLGGVVDSRHRVYGVERLRVIDASNLPFQVSSHLMSVMYGLTERAADIIKVDNGGSAGTVNEADTLGASEGNSTSNGDSNSDSNSNSTSSESADTGDDRNSATAASLSLWTVLLSVSAAYFL